MTCTDSTGRAALISGRRSLPDHLEFSPDVPVPIYSDVLTVPPDGDWTVMRAEIDVIAARLNLIARETAVGHYVAARSFGPVEIRAVATPPKSGSDNEESE